MCNDTEVKLVKSRNQTNLIAKKMFSLSSEDCNHKVYSVLSISQLVTLHVLHCGTAVNIYTPLDWGSWCTALGVYIDH